MFSVFKVLIGFSLLQCNFAFFDPFTIAAGVGLGALGYNFEYVKLNTYCRYKECCIDQYIPNNVGGLRSALNSKLYGQHIVIKQLIPALSAHLDHSRTSRKPLVMSFHGTPGTGKNYVTDFIADYLYEKGSDSKYVHKFMGRTDFPREDLTNFYQAELVKKVKDAVSMCPRSLFIFDEVDKMPPGVFEALASLLDHHSNLNGIDFRKSIFIFLSNTAGIEIAYELGKLLQSGVYREKSELHNFEKTLETGAYNTEGGLQKARIIESHLVDHFIPFLPLEKVHVEKCIEDEFRRLGANPTREKIQKIIDVSVTFDKNTGLFSTTGCKRISKKVEVAVHSN